MVRYCADCGAQLSQSARFCVSCGAAAPPAAGTGSSGAPRRGGGSSGYDAPTQPHASVSGYGDDIVARRSPASDPARTEQYSGGGARGGSQSAPEDGTVAMTPFPAASTPPPAPRRARPNMVADQFSAWPDEFDEGRAAADPAATAVAPPAVQSYQPVQYAEPEPASRSTGYPEDGGDRSRQAISWPMALVGLSVVLIIGMLIVFLNQPDNPTPAANPSAPAAKPSAAATSSSAPSDPAAQAQEARKAIGKILEVGRGSRATLVEGLQLYCNKSDKDGGTKLIRDALNGRLAQLAKINEVGEEPFKALPGAMQARERLRAALQASADADQIYARMAESGNACQSPADLTKANREATASKTAFLDSWNPLMETNKLPKLVADDI